jgi:hypothetical protein
LNVSSKPPPTSVHCVADGHATAFGDANEAKLIGGGIAAETGLNVRTLPN